MRTRTYQPRTCERCGREYVPTSPTQRYCSQTCRFDAWAAMRAGRTAVTDMTIDARRAVAALEPDQRMRLRAMLATTSQWSRMVEEVVLS